MADLEDELAEIWADDLLGRRSEAQMVADYIASAYHRNVHRQHHLSALAVDAPYGEGKTFFLRHLASHIALEHPVAFIDAWSDDLADDPLTALAATLADALSPLLPKSTELSSRWHNVREKTGKIAGLAAKGLAKRGLALLITGPAVEGIEHVISGVSDATQGVITDSVQKAAEDASKSLTGEHILADPAGAMDMRIAEFKAGRNTIEELRNGLRSMVDKIADAGKSPPIVIIIDELDRCRPAYAVKLLEEIKHLFDVPGIFFVFGIFGDQLASAMTGAYGSAFDGRSYLRRFINRTYRLRSPSLQPFVASLLIWNSIPEGRLHFPPINEGQRLKNEAVPSLIARYLRVYGASARDVIAVIEAIETCLALTRDATLEMALLLPLLISKVKGNAVGEIVQPIVPDTWDYGYHDRDGRLMGTNFQTIANTAPQMVNWTMQRVTSGFNDGDLIADLVMNQVGNNQHATNPLADPRRYVELVEAMGRFTVVVEAPGNA